MNLLITGGAGFIGSNFVRFLLQREAQARIINLDALTYAGSMENLIDLPDPARHIFVHGDICDRPLVDRLLVEFEIDAVVHFAAETHVDRSILGPDQFIHTNIMGTYTLLEAARSFWSQNKRPDSFRFYHISTDEVFGSLAPDEPPFTETTKYAPKNPYAASKASGDHLVRAYGSTYGLPYLLTNCANNYGPRQFPEKLIPLTLLNAFEGKPLPVYGDGQQVRDWLFVDDHCNAIWKVIQKGKPGETYNIGGGCQPTNLEIVRTLCEILDEMVPDSPYAPHQQLVRFVPDRPGHDRRYAMDTRKILNDLNWQPQESLRSGLQKTARWYYSNKDWVNAIHKQQDYKSWLEKNYDQRSQINEREIAE